MTLPFQQPSLSPFSDFDVAKGQALAWEVCFSTLFPLGPSQHSFRHAETLNGRQTAVAEIHRLQQCARELAELSQVKGKADGALAQRTVSEAVPVGYMPSYVTHRLAAGDLSVMCTITAKPLPAHGVDVAIYTTPPAAPVAWDADATTRLRSIVAVLGLTDSVPEGNLTGHEFAVLGFVRREIERLKGAAPVALTPMGEKGNEWYFDCDGHYIDVKRDENGKYSVFFRNRADDTEAWHDQANVASPVALSDADIRNRISNAIYGYGCMLEDHAGVVDAIAKDLAAASQPTDAALQIATELAKAIWRDNYKATAPQWEPLSDLMGVLSQIDNMVCGMSRTTDADKRDADNVGTLLLTKQKQLAIAIQSLSAIACFHDSGANASLKFTGDYSCFDEPSSVRASRAALLQIEVLGLGYLPVTIASATKGTSE